MPIAAAGYHVVAPDQRGYGRTTGWDGDYDGDLDSFRVFNLVRDTLGLISALGYRSVAAVVALSSEVMPAYFTPKPGKYRVTSR